MWFAAHDRYGLRRDMANTLVKVLGHDAFRDTRSGAIVFEGTHQYQMALKRRNLSRQVALKNVEHAAVHARVHHQHDLIHELRAELKEVRAMHEELRQLVKAKKDPK